MNFPLYSRAQLIALLALSGLAATPALALSPEAVAGAVAQRFGVTVLRVAPIERDGKPLYSVVVMNPGGNFNEAFKATTLVVDPDSGDLVPQFRQENSGYDLPAAPDRQPPGDDGGTAIRRETFRGR
jgi:hypothetical protein